MISIFVIALISFAVSQQLENATTTTIGVVTTAPGAQATTNEPTAAEITTSMVEITSTGLTTAISSTTLLRRL